MAVRKFPAVPDDDRVETGPIQFGDDWPGIFFRGDNAMYFAYMLKMFLDGHISPDDVISKCVLQGLVSDLQSCNMAVIRAEEEQAKQEEK